MNNWFGVGTTSDFNEGLEVRSDSFLMEKNSQFCLFGLSVYLVIYSLMLFSNYSHNIFREISKNVRALLFKKVILDLNFPMMKKLVCNSKYGICGR